MLNDHSNHIVLDASSLVEENTETSLNALDTAWESYRHQAKAIAVLSSLHLFQIVKNNIPEVHSIVLREDTSHLPAHGHVHDILREDGTSLLPDADSWHDLSWTHEVDDYVWDIYETYGMYFSTDPADRIRKLYITASGR